MNLNLLTKWFGPSRGKQQAIQPLAFVHLHKTAGTSINEFLTNRFPANEFVRFYPEYGESFRLKLPRRAKLCYSGHVRLDEMIAVVPKQTMLFTILRDPVQRAISAFYGWKRYTREELKRRNPYLVPIYDLSLNEFLRQYPLLSLNLFGDFQTNYLGRPKEVGRVTDGSFVPPNRQDLGRAKDNLSRCLVGTTERLTDTIALLCTVRGWAIPDQVPKANVTPRKPKQVDLDKNAQEFFAKHTALDNELHQFAGMLLQEQLDKAQVKLTQTEHPVREYRLTFDQPIPGYGWHPREIFQGKYFCFSEPRAWLECPIPVGKQILVEIETLTLLPAEHFQQVKLCLNGQQVELQCLPTKTGAKLRGVIDCKTKGGKGRLELEALNPIRPSDLVPGSPDQRILSLAVTEVRLRAA